MPDITDGQRADLDVGELTPNIEQTAEQIAVGYFWHDVAAGANAGRPADQVQYSIGGRLYEVDKNATPLDGGGDVSIDCNAAANLADDIDAAVAAINGDVSTNVIAWNIDDVVLAVANDQNPGAAGNGLALADANDAGADVLPVTGGITVDGDDPEDVVVYEGKHPVEASDVGAWAAAGPAYTPINYFEVPVGTTPTLDYMQVWTATGQMRNPELVAGGLQLTHRLVNVAADFYALEVWDESGTLVATDIISWKVTAR
jgi:hypothetical protein